jgi:hypothetical protein
VWERLTILEKHNKPKFHSCRNQKQIELRIAHIAFRQKSLFLPIVGTTGLVIVFFERPLSYIHVTIFRIWKRKTLLLLHYKFDTIKQYPFAAVPQNTLQICALQQFS